MHGRKAHLEIALEVGPGADQVAQLRIRVHGVQRLRCPLLHLPAHSRFGVSVISRRTELLRAVIPVDNGFTSAAGTSGTCCLATCCRGSQKAMHRTMSDEC